MKTDTKYNYNSLKSLKKITLPPVENLVIASLS